MVLQLGHLIVVALALVLPWVFAAGGVWVRLRALEAGVREVKRSLEDLAQNELGHLRRSVEQLEKEVAYMKALIEARMDSPRFWQKGGKA